jgi:thymidylate synthase (FAD)
MRVTIVGQTQDPMDLLIMSKSTRLEMCPEMLVDIQLMSEAEKLEQLDYMVNTIKSSWEFFDISFLIEGVSRGFTHQFVRNRQGTYAQQTMRILPMTKFKYITGPTIKNNFDANFKYERAMEHIQKTYDELIAMGVAIEDARGILPTNICTNIMVKHNLRSLSDMLASRASHRTQDEYRQVCDAMYEVCVEKWPWIKEFLRDQKTYALKEIESIIHDQYDGTDKLIPYLKLVDQVRNAK